MATPSATSFAGTLDDVAYLREQYLDDPTNDTHHEDYILSVASLVSADDVEHFWEYHSKNNPAFCIDALRILIYAQERADLVIDIAIDAAVRKLDESPAKAVCPDCVIAYHDAKSSLFVPSDSHTHPTSEPPPLTTLYNHEINRQIATFSSFATEYTQIQQAHQIPKERKEAVKQITIRATLPLYEVLLYPETLQHPTVDEVFFKAMLPEVVTTQRNLKMQFKIFPAVPIFALHSNPRVRDWLSKSLLATEMRITPADLASMKHQWEAVFVVLSGGETQYNLTTDRAEMWKGLESLLGVTEDKALESLMGEVAEGKGISLLEEVVKGVVRKDEAEVALLVRIFGRCFRVGGVEMLKGVGGEMVVQFCGKVAECGDVEDWTWLRPVLMALFDGVVGSVEEAWEVVNVLISTAKTASGGGVGILKEVGAVLEELTEKGMEVDGELLADAIDAGAVGAAVLEGVVRKDMDCVKTFVDGRIHDSSLAPPTLQAPWSLPSLYADASIRAIILQSFSTSFSILEDDGTVKIVLEGVKKSIENFDVTAGERDTWVFDIGSRLVEFWCCGGGIGEAVKEAVGQLIEGDSLPQLIRGNPSAYFAALSSLLEALTSHLPIGTDIIPFASRIASFFLPILDVVKASNLVIQADALAQFWHALWTCLNAIAEQTVSWARQLGAEGAGIVKSAFMGWCSLAAVASEREFICALFGCENGQVLKDRVLAVGVDDQLPARGILKWSGWLKSVDTEVVKMVFHVMEGLLKLGVEVGGKDGVSEEIRETVRKWSTGVMKNRLEEGDRQSLAVWIGEWEGGRGGWEVEMADEVEKKAEFEGHGGMDIDVLPDATPEQHYDLTAEDMDFVTIEDVPEVIDLSASEVSQVGATKVNGVSTGSTNGVGHARAASFPVSRAGQHNAQMKQGTLNGFVTKDKDAPSIWAKLGQEALESEPEKRKSASPASGAFKIPAGKPTKAAPAKAPAAPVSKGAALIQQLKAEAKAETRNVPIPGRPTNHPLPSRPTPQHASTPALPQPNGVNGIRRPNIPDRAPMVTEMVVSRDESEGSSGGEKVKRSIQVLSGPSIQKPGTKINTPGGPNPNEKLNLRDINDLYRMVLAWDVEMEGEVPPNFDSGQEAQGSGGMKLQKMEDIYGTSVDYAGVFEPLCVVECWSQLMRAKEEMGREEVLKGDLKGVTGVDDFHELQFTTRTKETRLQEHDVMQIYTSHDVSIPMPTPLPPSMKSFMGVIKSSNNRDGATHFTVRIYLHARPTYDIHPLLKPSTQFSLVRTYSLTTTYREYHSIITMPKLGLLSEVLKPTRRGEAVVSEKEVDRVAKKFGVNEPQARAIAGAVEKKSGFVLIQGPPGSGKTKTILSLISAFLTGRQGTAISVPGGGGRPISVGAGRNRMGAPPPQMASKSMQKKTRMICCAPSNAAIDEIARRLKAGINDGKGGTFVPKLVRIGTAESVHPGVRDIALENLVEKTLLEAPAYKKYLKEAQEYETKTSGLKKRITALKDERESLRALEANPDLDSGKRCEVERKIGMVSKQIGELGSQLSALTEGGGGGVKPGSAQARDRAKRSVKVQVLEQCDVVLCTLSGAGHDILGEIQDFEFPTVIIDEACQSVELSTLIPLRHGAKKCIMVGDPNQLPPTVISEVAKKYEYERSLFQRIMATQPGSVHLLSIQYRMHPSISVFPSAQFYGNKLRDAPDLSTKCAAVWHQHPKGLFPPYRVWNVKEGREVTKGGGGGSFWNLEEASLCADLVVKLCSEYKSLDFAGKIGVITFYKKQVRIIKDEFIQRFGREVLDKIDIGTVDGFQGQEKDIIILSCVRANPGGGVGFIRDVRRMNVALTRSKSSCFVLGHCATLRNDRTWRRLVDDAEARGNILDLTGSGFKRELPNEIPRNILGQIRASSAEDGDVKMEDAEEDAEGIHNHGVTISRVRGREEYSDLDVARAEKRVKVEP